MADQPQRYFYGRLNLIGSYQDKQSFLLQGLASETTLEAYGHVWRFVELAELNSSDGVFLHGYLIKYKRETVEEVVTQATGELSDLAIPNVVVAKARFFLHVESGIIAYHPVPGQIEPRQFRERVVRLFIANHQGFFVDATLESIEEQYALRDEVRRMTTVERIHISLHPSNPSTRDAWQRIDDRLKKLGTRKYTEEYQTRPDILEGPEVIADEEILAKLLMAEDGYGEAQVKGRIDGKIRTIKTHDKPVTSEAPGDDTPPAQVLESILITARTIFRRFSK
jgi:hypothetical protein